MEIRIENLAKEYRGGKRALDNVNLTITNGLFGLLGPNGAGKTTLMQIMATVLAPTSGSISYGPYTLGRDDQRIRQMLGYMPQMLGVYDKLTGEEFLHYVSLLKGIKQAAERQALVAKLLRQVNMEQHSKRKMLSYSGGMKQRIGIAQALIGDPRVVIVDEPTAGLDPEERIRFRNLLEELALDRIIVLSTHIVADIESSCQSVAVMDQGEVKFHGALPDLLTLVEGKVWAGEVAAGYGMLPDTYAHSMRVVSRRRTQRGYSLRIVSANQPFAEAAPAEPGVEDAYIWLTGGEAVDA